MRAAREPTGSGRRQWPVVLGLRATLAAPLQPLADRSGADSQGFGDVPLGPTLLQEMPGWPAACFFPVVRCRVHAWHGRT